MGHSQLEVDSVHSIIERQVSKFKITIPSDWIEVFRSCRTSRPFTIHEMTHNDFLNWKGNFYLSRVDKRRLDIKEQYWFRFHKGATFFETKQTFLDEEEFKTHDLNFERLPRLKISPAYSAQIPLSQGKKLAQYQYILQGVIPHVYLNVVNEMPSQLSEDELLKAKNQVEKSYNLPLTQPKPKFGNIFDQLFGASSSHS